jgi:hypothetical protein
LDATSEHEGQQVRTVGSDWGMDYQLQKQQERRYGIQSLRYVVEKQQKNHQDQASKTPLDVVQYIA